MNREPRLLHSMADLASYQAGDLPDVSNGGGRSADERPRFP